MPNLPIELSIFAYRYERKWCEVNKYRVSLSYKDIAATAYSCTNCGSHNFISFRRIPIDNNSCFQRAKCHMCKSGWIEFWYMPEQRLSFYTQSSLSSRKNKIKKKKKEVKTKCVIGALIKN